MEEKAKPAPQKRSFFSKLKHPSQFNNHQLVLFVIAFGIIGYLIYQTFAASTLVASLQAEQMSLPSGASIFSDSTASGGKAVYMGKSGTISGSVNFPSSVSSLTVRAKGHDCSSYDWMKVLVDGKKVFGGYVKTTSWSSYSVSFSTAYKSGTHTLAIGFTNDYNSSSCNGYLDVDVTNFFGPTTITPAPTIALSASPTSVSAGQSSTLTWTSTNASSCTASGSWSGTEPTSGSVSTGALNQNSTYSLACTGAGGSTTANTTVTVAAAATTYDSAISYTQTRPAFTPTRTINVSDAASLKSAIANLQPGDYVKASAPFTVSSSTNDALVIGNRLSTPAVIDLTGVTIEYTGTSDYDSVWIKNIENVRIYGGNITMTQPTLGGGSCITWYASQHSMWWGFNAHDCGSNGLSIFTARTGYTFAGPVEYNDIQGEVGHFSLNGGRFDPHTEKCSGLHGANLADGNYYAFDHNRIALYVHDSPCTGGGIEFGSSQSTPLPTQNTIYLKCVNLTFVSTTQTGGNCYQTWGYGETYTDIKYLEADNLTGHAYWAGGLYSKTGSGATALTTDALDYGRATNVNQNPRYANDPRWDKTGGTVFKDISPTP